MVSNFEYLEYDKLRLPKMQIIQFSSTSLSQKSHRLPFSKTILLNITNISISFRYSEEDIQLSRLMDRSGLSEADAKKRIAVQMPLEKKCEMSDFVIENSSSSIDTEEQTLKILEILLESNHHWKVRGIILATAAFLLSGVAWLLNYKYKIFSE